MKLKMIILSKIHEHTLEALEEQVLGLELVEVVGVDHEDRIVKNVTKGCTNDQGFSSVTI